MPRYLDAEGRPLREPARNRAWHMLEVIAGATAHASPAMGVEVHVVAGAVRVVHWIAGQPFWVLTSSGRA